MGGVSISRWTMSFFAGALMALGLSEGLMAIGYGFPAQPFAAPQTLVLVHLVVIGWLSLLMCGALFQFVPVIVARPLYSDAMPLPTLAALTTGLAALVLGFLSLGDGGGRTGLYFSGATVLLGVGFGLALWNLGLTLWAARPLPLPARFIAVGLASLGPTVLLGGAFALVLGGVAAHPHLQSLTALGVPVHVIAGLGGWLTVTSMGVSYRLFSMFMLSRELTGRTTQGVLHVGAAGLAVAILGGTVCACLGLASGVQVALAAAGVLALAALALYGRDVVHLYRARKRRALELNSRMARLALASLAGAAVLTTVLIGVGGLAHHVGAVVFLAVFGWLTGLGLVQLYKIVAFLTWLETYGPVLGKAPAPRVQDLVVERRAAKWFWLYFLAVWAAVGALLAGSQPAFRLAAGVMLIATGGVVAQLVRTRLLADIPAAARLPVGARRPNLLYASSKPA